MINMLKSTTKLLLKQSNLRQIFFLPIGNYCQFDNLILQKNWNLLLLLMYDLQFGGKFNFPNLDLPQNIQNELLTKLTVHTTNSSISINKYTLFVNVKKLLNLQSLKLQYKWIL